MKVTVIRSNRKTVAIQVNSDLGVTVRAPRSALEKDIEEILKKKEATSFPLCILDFSHFK